MSFLCALVPSPMCETMRDLKSHLKRRAIGVLWLSLKTRQTAGFTLLELLVALVIGSIVVAGLLYGVVEILQVNQRDSSRSDTQREIQAALDYMARDLREAVYVYDGRCLTGDGTNPFNKTADQQRCPGLLNYLPANLKSSTNLPVLAFWRVDPFPQSVIDACRTNSGSSTAWDFCVSQRMYTLVVYSLNTEPSPLWRGKARITRYELPQFQSSAAISSGAPTNTSGWVNPLQGITNFETWPWGILANSTTPSNLQTGAPPAYVPSNSTLTDFIDNSVATRPITPIPAVTGVTPAYPTNGSSTLCPQPAYDPNNPTQGGFVLTPGNNLATGSLSMLGFYACVRGADANSLNQEVAIYIRGNAAGRPGIPTWVPQVPFLMDTRVLTRGAIGKTS